MKAFANIILIAVMAVAFTILCALGFWQLQRLEWKEAMIERVEQGLSSPAVPLSEIEAMMQAGTDIEYRPVTTELRYLHDGEQHYFATHKSQPGYFIYTPAELRDGRRLFVNRGFVPMELKEQSRREAGLTKGWLTIKGLARTAPAEKPNTFVPNNDLAKNVYHWKSLSQMAGNAYDKMVYDTVGFFLDADDTPVPGGWPVGGVTRISFPNSHLQYAFTWFGLAAALLGVGGYFLFSRRRIRVKDREAIA